MPYYYWKLTTVLMSVTLTAVALILGVSVMSPVTRLMGELQTSHYLNSVDCINYSYSYGEVTEDLLEAKSGHHIERLSLCIVNAVRVCVSLYVVRPMLSITLGIRSY